MDPITFMMWDLSITALEHSSSMLAPNLRKLLSQVTVNSLGEFLSGKKSESKKAELEIRVADNYPLFISWKSTGFYLFWQGVKIEESFPTPSDIEALYHDVPIKLGDYTLKTSSLVLLLEGANGSSLARFVACYMDTATNTVQEARYFNPKVPEGKDVLQYLEAMNNVLATGEIYIGGKALTDIEESEKEEEIKGY